MPRFALHVVVALLLSVAALSAVSTSLTGEPRWTPDGLFYQARALELQGADRDAALERTFGGPMGARLRAVDPERSGDPSWVGYHAAFYERRVALPLAATVIEPVSGERAILDLSIAGYVAAVLVLFVLLLIRFRLATAAAVTLATVFLPALTHHSSFPLTDSWGLALETAALASAILVLERGPRWLVPWTAVLLVLSFTRDSSWVLILAAAWVAFRLRSRVGWGLLGTAVVATVPVLLLYSVPTRELLATMLNDFQPAPDASWGFVVQQYPGALVELVRADGGFVREGAWYSAAYLAAGVALLFALTRGARGDATATLLKAAAVAGLAYVLVVPIFSAFRLELALVPMAAFGLALAVEGLAERVTLPAWARTPAVQMGRPGP